MGFLDRILGVQKTSPPARSAPRGSDDDQAVARYRYLLRTAPPEAIEQAHAEAFAQLTPEQRASVLRELSAELPESERAAARQADPAGLARMATRAELRQPGILERVFGGASLGGAGRIAPAGMGLGGMMAGTLLSSIAGTFIGSAIAHQFLDGFDSSPEAGHDDASDASHADDPDQYAHGSHDADQDDLDEQEDYGSEDFGDGDFGDGDFGGDDFDV